MTISQVSTMLTVRLGLNPQQIHALRPGAWSSGFAFTANNHDMVIRFSAHADDFRRDAYAARFASIELPIPAVTHTGIVDGLHYAVSDRVHGTFIDDLSSIGLHRAMPSLISTLNALRVADVSTSSGYGLWDDAGNGMHPSWQHYLRASLEDSPEQRGGSWRGALESSPTGAASFGRDLGVFERLLNRLPNPRHLIHSDLLNFNVFVSNDRISGIVDWGCAMYGDFVYDLAWFAFWSPWYPQWSGSDVTVEAYGNYRAMGLDLANFRERLDCYQLHIGLGHQAYNASIGRWDDLADVARRTALLADEYR